MKKEGMGPVAVVEGEVSDFGEFLVGFVDERPVDFVNWNVAALRHLHRVGALVTLLQH